MEPRSLRFVVAACDGELLRGPEKIVKGVSIDSRQAQAGDLFFAIRGERFDGHDFLTEVAQKRAVAVVVERGKAPADLTGCAVIAVGDTRQALGQMAARYRQDFRLPIVAVGGSNGKTTAKDLIAGVLRQKLATVWSEASFNNDIGVPLTLLKLEKRHEAAVLEVGTNHPGELAPLVRMVQPKYGVITSIGREHLEFFGSVTGVAEEEGWLAELLPAGGKLFVSGDSELTEHIKRRTEAMVVRAGFSPANDWRARNIRMDAHGMAFNVDAPRAEFAGEYQIGLVGRHQVGNALFAVALGAELGLDRSEIQRGLAECKPARMRMQVRETGGVVVLDDTYNANTDSMLAALETLREFKCRGRRVAVLGDMAELGAHSAAAHEEVGRETAKSGVSRLFAIGKQAGVLGKAAQSAGLSDVEVFADVESATTAVNEFLQPGDVVLLKASRVMRLERMAGALRSSAPAEQT